MASRTKLLTELSVADLWKEVKDPATVWGDLTQHTKRAVKLLGRCLSKGRGTFRFKKDANSLALGGYDPERIPGQ